MTTSACAFPDGVIHDHGNAHCHEASRRAGAVEALREAADELDAQETVGNNLLDWELGRNEGHSRDARILRARADLIASGKAVTS